MPQQVQLGRWIWRNGLDLCRLVHWIHNRRWPLEDIARVSRIIIVCCVLMATVFALMDVTNRWLHHLKLKFEDEPQVHRVSIASEQTVSLPESGSESALLKASAENSPPTPNASLLALFETNRNRILGSWVAVLVIHLGYWSLLARDLVFTKPLERIRVGTLLFPVEMVIAYGMGAVGTTEGWHLASIIAFFAIYLILLMDEIGDDIEPSEERLNGEERRRLVWICVDVMLVGCLAGYLIDYYFLAATPSTRLVNRAYLVTIGAKEAIITLNLIGSFFAYVLTRHQDRAATNGYYRSFYNGIISGGRYAVSKPATIPSAVAQALAISTPTATASATVKDTEPQHPISLLQVAMDAIESDQGLIVIDYGCAAGTRVIPMLAMLGIDLDRVLLVGIDKDPTWADAFKQNCGDPMLTGGANLKHRFFASYKDQECQVLIKKASLLIAAHIFHHESVVSDFSDVVRMRPDAPIIVCGCSPRNYLAGPVAEVAIQGIFPRVYYRWETSTLSSFMTKFDLKAIDNSHRQGNTQPKKMFDFNRAAYSDACAKLPRWRAHVWHLCLLTAAATSVYLHWESWLAISLVTFGTVALWFTPDLIRRRAFLRIDFETEGTSESEILPYAIIQRELWLNSATLHDFLQWLEIMYGYRPALRHRRRLQHLLRLSAKHPGTNSIPFDDVVYALMKNPPVLASTPDEASARTPDQTSIPDMRHIDAPPAAPIATVAASGSLGTNTVAE